RLSSRLRASSCPLFSLRRSFQPAVWLPASSLRVSSFLLASHLFSLPLPPLPPQTARQSLHAWMARLSPATFRKLLSIALPPRTASPRKHGTGIRLAGRTIPSQPVPG